MVFNVVILRAATQTVPRSVYSTWNISCWTRPSWLDLDLNPPEPEPQLWTETWTDLLVFLPHILCYNLGLRKIEVQLHQTVVRAYTDYQENLGYSHVRQLVNVALARLTAPCISSTSFSPVVSLQFN